MDFEINREELEAIQRYRNDKYIEINQLLVNDVELDISLANRRK